MTLIDTRALPEREPKPGWHGRFFDSASMSFAQYTLDPGASLHEHSHPHEEVWNVISGEIELTIGAERHRAGAGFAAVVPPNTAHSVKAIAPSVVLIVDHPLRAAVGGKARAALAVRFDAPLDPASAPAGAPIAIHYVLENLGRATGVVRKIEIESGVAAKLAAPERTRIPTGELPARIAIAGGETHAASHTSVPLSAAERERLGAGKAVFYVRGAVFYDDGDGERHHATFCRVLDGSLRLVAPQAPGYNYGD